MSLITFLTEGNKAISIDANPGETLLDLARKANVAIDAPCSGNGACGKCRVRLSSGKVDSFKTRHISDEEYEAGWRLACSSKVVGDAVIEVPDIAQAYRNRMKISDLDSPLEIAIFDELKSEMLGAGFDFKSDLSFINLDLTMPSLTDTMPDNERVLRGVKEATGYPYEKIILPYCVLKNLSKTLRESDWKVKCVISKDGDFIYIRDILPSSDNEPMVGFALDVGTTTLAGVLVDLESGKILAKGSCGNGQIRYGADVINRIIESVKPDGRRKLQDAVVKESIIPMLSEMYKSAGINPRHIYRMVMAGNTTMNHLLLGLYADPVRMEPFVPSFFRTDHIYVRDIGLKMNDLSELIISPNIGSYVGGDITAGSFASMIWNKAEMSLFIDLGTNGELVFGNSDFLLACACSAGPAFEGGDISCGMRATDGAIEACTIDKDTMEPAFSVIGQKGEKPVGICGSGIIDIIAELFRCGIIDGKGKIKREGRRIKRDVHGMGSFILAFKSEAGGEKDVEINEVDIDNFIRAKGAIFSATITMLDSLGFDPSVIQNVYVAGGIGSGINMKNAVTIGMFPDIPIEYFHYIGNSSQTGAYAMLLSSGARKKVWELSKSMTYLELSNEPKYMDNFVAACFLPHTDATLFPSVKEELSL